MIQVKPQLIDEFLNSQSPSTSKQYERDLQRFFEFVNYKSIESLSIQDCLSYRQSMHSKAPNTVNRRLASVKSYLKFNQRFGSLRINPMECIPLQAPGFVPTSGLSNAEVESILKAAESNPLHYAILSMLFYLGLRRSELCKLTFSDLNSDGIHSTIRINGKGGKQRTLPIPSFLVEKLQSYMNHSRARICEVSDPIFIGKKQLDSSKGLNPASILKIFKKYSLAINANASPHSARVTAVSNALENGANPVYVQAMGGWSSMDMILLYDRRRKELKNSAVFKINYGGK